MANWTDAMIAIGTVGLVLATVGLAIVAWFQIGETRRASREIFARQSRQKFLELEMKQPHLAARNVDLRLADERECYFAFVSVLFSTLDDCLEFIDDDNQAVISKMIRDLTSHVMFISNSGIEDWKFYFSGKALRVILVSLNEVSASAVKQLLAAEEEAESKRAHLRSFDMMDWISNVDAVTGALEDRLRTTFIRLEANFDMEEMDSEANQALGQCEGFRELPEGQLRLVEEYLSARKRQQLLQITLDAFHNARSALREALELPESDDGAQM